MTNLAATLPQAGHDSAWLVPPAPRTVEDTSLSLRFLGELLSKVMVLSGRSSLSDLAAHVKLPANVLESALLEMRSEGLCELARRGENNASTFYQLTDAGRERSLAHLRRSQYAGVAPVSLADYTRQVERQSIREVRYTREMLAEGFRGVVVQPGVLDRVGAALNSGRALILYGPPGCGKTYLAERLAELVSGDIAVPYSVEVDGEVVQVFDPHIHTPVAQPAAATSLARHYNSDARWIICKRPVGISGGELTLKMLDLAFDHSRGYYQAPPHVKANNGVFVVDDLGRQLLSPRDLMNRWIVPLDRRTDFLTLHTGYKFRIPFDVIVVFSSNQHPDELGDEAFLRRLGYKIALGPLAEPQYRQVFTQVSEELAIPFSESAYLHMLEQLHYGEGRPLYACYPRDVLSQLRDLADYEARSPEMTTESLQWAWRNYFATPAK
ncbi:AAA family ATPase [Lacisediminimonas sp.]|uniref:AAA family ATPase n=1 Tax=Lacisediminimonas sp. TaxID=3060582 RepID=UPI0027171748|nr:AAA family ATPase [Lacisediminimonas sp.]MDO8300222.1 AAA family ATPase [Lacisediminimonas sp.]